MVWSLQKQKILRRGVKNTQKNCKGGGSPNNLNNHNGVITHLEADILECEVRWTLASITMNKASGGDEITSELLQILTEDAGKALHSKYQQTWKTQQY